MFAPFVSRQLRRIRSILFAAGALAIAAAAFALMALAAVFFILRIFLLAAYCGLALVVPGNERTQARQGAGA